jgi:hypothetical protein
LSEITEKRRLLNSPKKRWYTFFPNPDYDHPDNAVSDYAYTEETRLFGVTRWGMPSLNMIPVFRRDGSIRGYRSQTPDDPPTPIVILISLWADTRRRPITRKAWNAVLGKITHLFKYLGPVDLDLISPEDLAAFLAALLASGLKPAVVDDYLVYIKSVFAAAKEATVIFANPAENLRRARPTEKHRREGP